MKNFKTKKEKQIKAIYTITIYFIAYATNEVPPNLFLCEI